MNTSPFIVTLFAQPKCVIRLGYPNKSYVYFGVLSKPYLCLRPESLARDIRKNSIIDLVDKLCYV